MHVVRVIAIADGGEGAEMQTMADEAPQTRGFNLAPRAVAPAPVLAGTNASTVSARVDFALAGD